MKRLIINNTISSCTKSIPVRIATKQSLYGCLQQTLLPFKLTTKLSLHHRPIITNTSSTRRHLYHSSKTGTAAVQIVQQQQRGVSSSSSSSSSSVLNPDFIKNVTSTLPHLKINTNKYELETHGKGESYHPSAPPAAIITPTSNEDISHIVKLCNKYNIPLIPYGTGTSVEGHISALRPGSISLDMKEFKFIDDTNNDNDNDNDGGLLEDSFIMVGAGVTRLELNDRLRHTGMQFMVDPGADASIGGMVACGASGTTAVKYGTMRENILSLQCVLPDGTIAKCGTKALKSSAGYDLVSLMTGSEGTLGIITHVTVKLHPIPNHITSAVCTFDSLYDAAEAVAMMRMCSISVERCEILDASSVQAFLKYTTSNNNINSNINSNSNNNGNNNGNNNVNDNNYEDNTKRSSKATNMEIKPTLFLEFTGPSKIAVQEQVHMTEGICTDLNGSNFQFTADEKERNSLWEARHQLYYASFALRNGGAKSAIVTDACVPLSSFAKVITETVDDVARYGVIGPCFGHAGDGNFHCILPMLESDTDEYVEKLHLVNDNLIKRTIGVGGTCTGEHGVGYGKIKYLKQQYGEGGVHMMELVKRGLDPNNIMNPGKVVIIEKDV